MNDDLFNTFIKLTKMADLIDALENANRNEMLLQMDVAYLARAYVDGVTEFELPMVYDSEIEIPTVSYHEIVRRVKARIMEYNPRILIDECLLMTYVDYYYETVYPNVFSPE